MPSRHKKSKKLYPREIDEFMEAATRLHRACCGPDISTMSEDYKTLSHLNSEICDAICKITGKEPPWMASNATYGAIRAPD